MAQAGFTPIQLYRTTTASAQPSAGNLADGELAINLTDKKLYAKDASNNVFLLADAASGGPTAANLAGGAAGSLPYQTGANATTFLGIGTAAQVLQVNSGATAPEWVNTSGTGDVARTTSPSFTTPSLGAATALSINSLTLTTSTGTFTLANGKTLTVNNSLTLNGTDATVMTFPSTSATIARTDAAQTFTGTQTVQAAATQDAVALAGRAGGTSSYVSTLTPTTLSASRTVTLPDADTTVPVATQVLTFTGPTAGRTITLPDANFTVARSDAAQSFTGTQTFLSNPVLDAGTANGVLYLNGSKVVTSGSALTFDGSVLGVNNAGDSDFKLTTNNTGSSSTDGLLLRINSTGSEAYLWNWESGSSLIFGASASEQMRLTSTGLGIGTSSPEQKLDVYAASGTIRSAVRSGTSFLSTFTSSVLADGSGIFVNAGSPLSFAHANTSSGSGYTERMRLDTSGNLGLGVTPSVWASLYKAFTQSSVNTSTFSFWDGTQPIIGMVNGGFVNAAYSWQYTVSGRAVSRYAQQGDGTHQWLTAPSGTAGDPISFSQVMTLDASGNLGIGTTSPTAGYRLHLAGSSGLIRLQRDDAYIQFANTANTDTAYIQQTASVFNIVSQVNGPIVFGNNSIERMRLDSSGNLGLGVTPSAWWSGSKAMQIGLGGYVQGRTGTAAAVEIGSNQFINGSIQRTYIQNGSAAYYEQSGGNHQWFTSTDPTPIAGNPISFSQVMTLDASGRLGLGGTTSPSHFLDITGAASTGANNSATGADVRLRQIYTRSRANSAGISGDLFAGQLFHVSGGAAFEIYNADNFPLVFGTNATERARITSGGDFVIGDTTTLNSNAKLSVWNSSAGGSAFGLATGYGTTAGQFRLIYLNSTADALNFDNGNNNATLTSGGTWTNASDARLKKNIQPIKYGLETVLAAQPRSFNRVDVAGDYIGFIAQELQTHIPEVVYGDENTKYSVDYGSLVAVAFKAIQEQQALITDLRARVAALEA